MKKETGDRWSHEEYADYLMRKRTLNSTNSNSPSRAEAATDKVQAGPTKKKNRFAENAGELGQKIHARREQVGSNIRLWLPYPPSTNNRMASVRGRMIKSAEARSYQKIVKDSLVDIKPLTGDVELSLSINRPRRRGDIDNVLKNILDALTGVAFVDDEQIAVIEAKRRDGKYARENPGVHIQLAQIV